MLYLFFLTTLLHNLLDRRIWLVNWSIGQIWIWKSVFLPHPFPFIRIRMEHIHIERYWVSQKKLLHKSEGKSAAKKEDDVAES